MVLLIAMSVVIPLLVTRLIFYKKRVGYRFYSKTIAVAGNDGVFHLNINRTKTIRESLTDGGYEVEVQKDIWIPVIEKTPMQLKKSLKEKTSFRFRTKRHRFVGPAEIVL